jgi:hypothetical protein
LAEFVIWLATPRIPIAAVAFGMTVFGLVYNLTSIPHLS